MDTNNKQNIPVGIFDSGLGGLSIWQECRKLLPYNDFCYVADSCHCPYGNKSNEEIIALSENIADFLVQKGCRLIVVACNTATTAAISYLRDHFRVHFVGTEPAVKPAAAVSQTGVIGVLATRGTIESDLYNNTRNRYASSVRVVAVSGDGLVEAVEENRIYDPATKKLLQSYINHMVDEGVDQLVLGCTHYPFLIEMINEIAGNKITVINPARAIASRVYDLLSAERLIESKGLGEDEFYTTGNSDVMTSFLQKITAITYAVKQLDCDVKKSRS